MSPKVDLTENNDFSETPFAILNDFLDEISEINRFMDESGVDFMNPQVFKSNSTIFGLRSHLDESYMVLSRNKPVDECRCYCCGKKLVPWEKIHDLCHACNSRYDSRIPWDLGKPKRPDDRDILI